MDENFGPTVHSESICTPNRPCKSRTREEKKNSPFDGFKRFRGQPYYRSLNSTPVMALSISFWANYTSGKPKLQRKSENSVDSGHVLKFTYDKEGRIVKSVVQASMRDKSYNVFVSLPWLPSDKLVSFLSKYVIF